MGALSDLAAVGATPLGALVALCVPGDGVPNGSDGSDGSDGNDGGELAVGVMAGVAEASAASGCPVLGGDLSGATQLSAAVTVLGTIAGGEPAAVARSGAQAGDVVLVTGPCGGSAAGLRQLRAGAPDADAALSYRRPVARLAEGALARRSGVHAMMDVSDGLALDLHRLADASGVGFRLDDVPVSAGATLDEALGGGEDYELLVALDASVVDALCIAFEGAGLRAPRAIGVLGDDPSQRVLRGEPLARLGWQHRVG
jgi:thiamine-monophosphate kinase